MGCAVSLAMRNLDYPGLTGVRLVVGSTWTSERRKRSTWLPRPAERVGPSSGQTHRFENKNVSGFSRVESLSSFRKSICLFLSQRSVLKSEDIL